MRLRELVHFIQIHIYSLCTWNSAKPGELCCLYVWHSENQLPCFHTHIFIDAKFRKLKEKKCFSNERNDIFPGVLHNIHCQCYLFWPFDTISFSSFVLSALFIILHATIVSLLLCRLYSLTKMSNDGVDLVICIPDSRMCDIRMHTSSSKSSQNFCDCM